MMEFPSLHVYNMDTLIDHKDAELLKRVKSLPVAESNNWTNFCALLSSRFGQIDPDAEFWDQLHDLRQGSSTAAQYVHKVRYCFNGKLFCHHPMVTRSIVSSLG